MPNPIINPGLSKSQLSRLVASGRMREIFTHQTLGAFDVTELRRRISNAEVKFERFHADCNDELIHHLETRREVDKNRALELTSEQLSDPAIVLLIPEPDKTPDYSHLIIDGNHRIYARCKRGMKHWFFYLVDLADAPRKPTGPGWADIQWGEKQITSSGFESTKKS